MPRPYDNAQCYNHPMIALPQLHRRTFLSGPAGTGKTTLAVAYLRELLQSGASGDSILILAPQRSLLKPYQVLLHQADLPAGEQVDALTLGGLARRSVDLTWPAIAADAGFTHPDQPPTFLTLETAQYYMEFVVRPFVAERFYFENVRLQPKRLYSQLLDNLNKAALIGFAHTQVGQRLTAAWEGPSAQTITFAQVQDCLDRFREFCLTHTLLDFSLQIELFRDLLKRDWFCERLYHRYRHLIVENVEEDTPIAHDLLHDGLPRAASALIVYDTDAGYRSFLGADARSGYALRDSCDDQSELTHSHVMPIALRDLEDHVTRILGAQVTPQPSLRGTKQSPPIGPEIASQKALAMTQAEQLRARSDLPMQTSSHTALEFGGGRFHPQMIDWVAARIVELVKQRSVEPREDCRARAVLERCAAFCD